MTTRQGVASSPVRMSRGLHACSECGWQTAKWVGRCAGCGAWGSLAEATRARSQGVSPGTLSPVRPITEVGATACRSRPTGLSELDRVLGGGLVPGSITLLSGEPGVGKSTLLLDVAARMAAKGRALYVSGEESASQVKIRAERMGIAEETLFIAAETDAEAVLAHTGQIRPELLVVDSIQTISSSLVEGGVGGVSQVRHVAGALSTAARTGGIATILVGHVTKDGTVAGPRTLEHLVDVVISIEGDRHQRLRMLRASKNRFGPSDEVGCFELLDTGIRQVVDPSALFMTTRREPTAGTCVTVAIEGSRPLVAEVQALVDPTTPGTARRITHGLDGSRVAMILAVLERRAGVGLRTSDAYVSSVGGAKIAEPAADLAILLAAASAVTDKPVPGSIVAVGEVGLAGEIRRVTGVAQRVAQAARLGFDLALVPEGTSTSAPGMRTIEVSTVQQALIAAGQAGPQPSRSETVPRVS